ncbi:MAG: HAMP domain-containing histidine kinase [Nitrospirae bacterium]|nr:HAMP domain-containing histidine kinase [Nitrospirota bacterium]
MTISRHLKLTLFWLIGIACLVAVAAVWVRDRIHEAAYATLQRQMALATQLGVVETTVLQALDAESRFLLRYPVEGVDESMPYVGEAHAAAQSTRTALKAIVAINAASGLPPSNPSREALEGQLSLFEVELGRVVRLITHKGDANSGLVGEMKRMADGLNQYLESLYAAENRPGGNRRRRAATEDLLNHLLFIRSWEKDYLLWNDRDILVPATRRVAQVIDELTRGPLTGPERRRIITYLHTYMIYFERVALNSVQLFTELDRTAAISDELQGILGRYAEAEIAHVAKAEERTRQYAHNMNMALFGLIAVLLLIATLLAVRLTRRITGRLETLVQATEQLGEHGDVAPIVMHTQDEFARLADAFNGMVAKLSEAQVRLVQSEKLAATGTLSASIAHEINNPLFGIQGCLERILKRLPQDDPDWRLVSLAMREGQRIARLVEGLRDFHRPSDQTMTTVDLVGVLDDVFLINDKYLQGAKVNLVRKLPKVLPKVKGTRDQLQMVFVNLLSNAVEAMPGGGTITVEARLEPGHVLLRFTDTGKGISREDLPHLFEPFFSTKPEVKGVGLGLSISYGIIKRHGGEIRVSSEPGRTDFVVVLPLMSEAPGPVAGT